MCIRQATDKHTWHTVQSYKVKRTQIKIETVVHWLYSKRRMFELSLFVVFFQQVNWCQRKMKLNKWNYLYCYAYWNVKIVNFTLSWLSWFKSVLSVLVVNLQLNNTFDELEDNVVKLISKFLMIITRWWIMKMKQMSVVAGDHHELVEEEDWAGVCCCWWSWPGGGRRR